MVDEDIADLSPVTVYHVLKKAALVGPWRRRAKPKRDNEANATRPDQRWTIEYVTEDTRSLVSETSICEQIAGLERGTPRRIKTARCPPRGRSVRG